MNAVETMLKDIKRALDNDCLWAALSLSLSIPDICGKIKYPNDKPRARFIKWFDEYLGQYEKCPTEEDEIEMPYLNGKLFFQLRCAFFHEGTNDIEEKDTSFNLDCFQFITCEKNDFEIYADSISTSLRSGFLKENDETTFCMDINIRNICNKIIWVTEAFLKEDCQDKKLPHFKVFNSDERYKHIIKENDIKICNAIQINVNLADIKNYVNYEKIIVWIYTDFLKLFGQELMQKYLLYVDNVVYDENYTLTNGYTPIITPIFKKYLILKTNISDFADVPKIIFQFSHELCHYVFYSLMDLNKPYADNEEEGICTAMSLCMLKKYNIAFEKYKCYVKNLVNEGYKSGYYIGESIDFDCNKVFDLIKDKVKKYLE